MRDGFKIWFQNKYKYYMLFNYVLIIISKILKSVRYLKGFFLNEEKYRKDDPSDARWLQPPARGTGMRISCLD